MYVLGSIYIDVKNNRLAFVFVSVYRKCQWPMLLEGIFVQVICCIVTWLRHNRLNVIINTWIWTQQLHYIVNYYNNKVSIKWSGLSCSIVGRRNLCVIGPWTWLTQYLMSNMRWLDGYTYAGANDTWEVYPANHTRY